MNAISELTRRNIFDALRLANVRWEGRLGESAFLARVFDLTVLPSHDRRTRDMSGDIALHRETFRDWGDDWVYEDSRLNLLHCSDYGLLRFLTEMVHPIVREDDAQVDELVTLFNRHLRADGFKLIVMDVLSGRRIFTAARDLDANAYVHARAVADDLASDHVAGQITRMQASIGSDPALAIGSAKEFVESICKGILAARGRTPTGKEDLPKLVYNVREQLDLVVDKRLESTLRSTLGALATLTQGIAELRGQLGTGHGASPDTDRPTPAVARLTVGAATALAVFLWDMHRVSAADVLPAGPAADDDEIPF